MLESLRTAAAAATIILSMTAALSLGGCIPQTTADRGERQVSTMAAHPGQIRMVDMFTKEAKEVPASDAPERQRFVYLKDGVEVSNAGQATERVPIVEVEMYPLDANGNLIAKEHAATIRIREYGPSHRLLRTTTMIHEPPD